MRRRPLPCGGFSPLGTSPNLLALGTKDSGASGFDDYGGELEIVNLDFTEPGLKCPVAGKVRANHSRS